MNKQDECRINAAECQRMADAAVDPIDRELWDRMADHWRYVSAGQIKRAAKRVSTVA